MEDGVHTFDGALQGLAVAQIALDRVDVVRSQQSCSVWPADDNPRADAFGAQPADELNANEAGGAGDENLHVILPP